jgi:AhpD family alkylhydroperoxidase
MEFAFSHRAFPKKAGSEVLASLQFVGQGEPDRQRQPAANDSIAARCDGCIAYHVHDALKAGATRKEIVETIGVAVLMGGGPATVYGAEAFEALNQFETAGVR